MFIDELLDKLDKDEKRVGVIKNSLAELNRELKNKKDTMERGYTIIKADRLFKKHLPQKRMVLYDPKQIKIVKYGGEFEALYNYKKLNMRYFGSVRWVLDDNDYFVDGYVNFNNKTIMKMKDGRIVK